MKNFKKKIKLSVIMGLMMALLISLSEYLNLSASGGGYRF